MERIFITGANRGIGLEVTRHYLRRGAVRLFAGVRQPEAARELRTLADQHPDTLTLISLEVTDDAAVTAAAKSVSEQVDGLDILINNAAINIPDEAQSLNGITAATMLNVLHVNTVAPLLVVQAFLPLLTNGKNPRLVNISSDMASLENRAYGGDYAYSTSKAALNMVTRGLAVDLMRQGIITIALDPGWVRTDMGGPHASLSTDESASGILRVINGLKRPDNGRFLRWDGGEHPW